MSLVLRARSTRSATRRLSVAALLPALVPVSVPSALTTLSALAILATLAVLAVLVGIPGSVPRAFAAEDPAGEASELLDRAFRNLYAEDYIQTLVLATQSRGGSEMRRRLQIIRRQSERPGKALLRFLYPQQIRRTSVLVLENENASDDLYVYLPAVKLTRHLSSAQRADSFFGTDLSYEDVEPKHIEDFRVRWSSDEDLEGTESRPDESCRRLEITAAPGFESAYDKQISCIEPERAIIVWTDFYVKGRRAKRLTIDPKEVRRIGQRYIPFLITVETPGRRSLTRVITEDYELRTGIPDRLFDTWNLASGDARSDRAKTRKIAPQSGDGSLGEPASGAAAVVHTGE